MSLGNLFSSFSSLQIGLFASFCLLQALFLLGFILLWRKQSRQEKKLHVFFGDKKARDLESILVEQLGEIRVLDQEIQELFEVLNKLRDLSLKTIHKVAVERFNPFKEVGGNQSFCVALLNGQNTGVVLSSLHTREGTRVYAKPVLDGHAKEFPFTDEEKETVVRAIHSQKIVTV
ncbi:MAG: DUF4446 family protein [Patescibacteria group bacterium]